MPHETEPEIFSAAGEKAAPAPKCRRAPYGILAALIVLAAAYSGFWYFMAGRVAEGLTAFMAQAGKDGAAIHCADLGKSGFPLRLELSCSSLEVRARAARAQAPNMETPNIEEPSIAALSAAAANADADENAAFAFKSGFVRAGAPVYAPHWVTLEMGAPAALKLPTFQEISAAWRKLRCAGDFTARRPRNITLTAEQPVLRNVPFMPGGAPLSADFIRFDSRRQEGDKALFSLAFDNLSLPYAPSGGAAALPQADGLIEMRIDSADAFYAALPQLLQSGDLRLLRGRSGQLNALKLKFEQGGGLALSGPFSVAQDGRLSGRITLAVQDIPALQRAARAALPAQQADNLESLLFLLNTMPKNAAGEPELTLDIKDGRARMGFIRMGKIPPL